MSLQQALLVIALWTVGTILTAASVAAQSVFTYARSVGARFELRTFDEQSGDRSTVLDDVDFLSIDLAGKVRKDQLRRVLSRQESVDGFADRILLPAGGALYRISRAGATELLLVPRSGAPTILLSIADQTGVPGLLEHVHVAPDESWVAASTANGDVLVAELGGGATVLEPTAQLAPLNIDPSSVRVSCHAIWFVADGELYRHRLNAVGPALQVDLGVDDPVDPELVLAGNGRAVVVAAVEQDGNMERRLFLVRDAGAPELVSDSNAQAISPAGLQHPLGPFLAVAPDAGVVAWRQIDGSDHEVLVQFTQATDDPIELTDNQTFANYIDSIGVFAFGGPRTLCFFAGDRHLVPFEPDERLAASDMYAVDLSDPSALELRNVTRTSQQALPPFVDAGDIDFTSATVGPHTEVIHLDLQVAAGAFGAGSFEISGGRPDRQNFARSAEQYAAAPQRFATPAGILLQESLRESVPLFTMGEDKVLCSGDPELEPVVRILVHDKTDPLDPSAKVFFDGQVGLGEAFEASAAAAGEHHLTGQVKVHILGLDDTPLQFVELDSDCSEPLLEGDRFGAVRLLSATAEDAPQDGAIDHCLAGSKPTAVTLALRGGGCAGTVTHQDPSKLRCSGVARQLSPVRVLASDDEDPFEGGAHVWFDGIVVIGEPFELVAAAAGESRLKNDTWVHVIDDAGNAVHSVRFHTSCSEPLVEGDRFGAFELLECLLEEPPLPDDSCAYGRPRTLTFAYEGRGCAPAHLGTRLRLDPITLNRVGGPQNMVAPSMALAAAEQGIRAFYDFPLGLEVTSVTPCQTGSAIGFVTTDTSGLDTVQLIDCWTGALITAVEDSIVGPCLGFSPSHGLLVPRQVGASFVLELYSPTGAVRTIDTGPEPFLPLLR